MYSKTKNVYYCEFCRKHGLRKDSIVNHEISCTANPNRICKWCENSDAEAMRALAAKFETLTISLDTQSEQEEAIYDLRNAVDGCPACMLSVLRRANKCSGNIFNYEEEVERYNKERQEKGDWSLIYG